jgi:hypothetical protein
MILDRLQLVRMEVLKLRRRRGLMAMALLIAVGSIGVLFAVRAARHGADPLHVPPAGGIRTFEDATDFLGMIAIVIGAMIGATAGAGDAELGTLRDALATGRSRLALFGSRAAAAVFMTAAILVVSTALVTTLSLMLAGSAPVPSLSELVQRDAAVLGFAVSSALVAAGVATFTRSRGPVMASLIAFGALISQVLIHVSFLGNVRVALPLVAFERVAGDAISGLHVSAPTGIAVILAWAGAAVAAGGWWARRVEV